MYRFITFCLAFVLLFHGIISGKESENVSVEKRIPVNVRCDLLVLGGSTACMAAALEYGKVRPNEKIIIVTAYPYLGEDVLGTLRLAPEEGEGADDPIALAIYGEKNENGTRKSPDVKSIKLSFERMMRDAGIEIVYDSPAIGTLHYDNAQTPSGAIFATKNGWTGIESSKMIEGTANGQVLEMIAGSLSTREPNSGYSRKNPPNHDPSGIIGHYEDIEYIVIGGEPKEISKNDFPYLCRSECERSTFSYTGEDGKTYPVLKYKIKIGIPWEYSDPLSDLPYVFYLNKMRSQLLQAVHSEGAILYADDYYSIPRLRWYDPVHYLKEWTDADSVPFDMFLRGNLLILNAYAHIHRDATREMLRTPNFIALGRSLGKRFADFSPTIPKNARILNAKIRISGSNRGTDRIETGAKFKESESICIHNSCGEFLGTDTIVPGYDYTILGEYDVLVLGNGKSGLEAAAQAAKNGAKTVFITPCGTTSQTCEKLSGRNIEVHCNTRPCAGIIEKYGERNTSAKGKLNGILAASPKGVYVYNAQIIIEAYEDIGIAGMCTPRKFTEIGSKMNVSDYLSVYKKSDRAFEVGLFDILNNRTYADTICKFAGEYTIPKAYSIDEVTYLHPFECSIPLRACISRRVDGLLLSGNSAGADVESRVIFERNFDFIELDKTIGRAAAYFVSENKNIRENTVRDLQKVLVRENLLSDSVLNEMDNHRDFRRKSDEYVSRLREHPRESIMKLSWYRENSISRLETYLEKNPDFIEGKRALKILSSGTDIELLLEELSSSREWNDRIEKIILLLASSGDERAIPAIFEKFDSLRPTDCLSYYHTGLFALSTFGTEEAKNAIEKYFEKLPYPQPHSSEKTIRLNLFAACALKRIDPENTKAASMFDWCSKIRPYLTEKYVEP